MLTLQKDDTEKEEEHFGLHIASVLRSLLPRQRAYAKVEIDRLLFHVQFLDMYGALGVGSLFTQPSSHTHQSSPTHPTNSFTPSFY